jgi:hypothetical protein
MISQIVARLARSAVSVALGGTLFLGASAANHVTQEPNPPRPFSAMERAEYDVRYGVIHAGSGTLSVLGIDTVRGRDAYRFRLTIGGGVNLLLYKYNLRDTLESWVDTATFNTLRFSNRQWHKGKPRIKEYEIFPERHTFRENDETEQGSVSNPVDEIAILFLARMMPLSVGSHVEISRYYKPAANPVVLNVVGRETIEAAGREWKTIVVQPIIKTTTMFADGAGRVWISDDSARVIVQVNAKASIGSVTLKLKNYTPAVEQRSAESP